MHKLLIIIFAFLSLLISPPSSANDSIRVVDGDTLVIEGVSIRLWGIDAPESNQICRANGREYSCGEDARFLLEALTKEEMRCETKDIDRYGRTVAQCFAGGHDIAALLVNQGYALDYATFSNGHYASYEHEAKAHKRGMWAGDFIAPADWRNKAPSKAANDNSFTKDTTQIGRHENAADDSAVKLSRSGICHAPGTTYYAKTRNFVAYPNLEACLKAGGRRPKR